MEQDPQKWLDYENKGNIGADIMLNPALFPAISKEIQQIQGFNQLPLTLIDIGAGTGSLSREFLLASPSQSDAISRCGDKILEVRSSIGSIINLDQERTYLAEGRNNTSDSRIYYKQGKADDLPLQDNSIDLAVSRQALMHLSPEQLQLHFTEIQRVLRVHSAYIFTVTGPDSEQQKYQQRHGARLVPSQEYEYPHGLADSQHLLKQYHHTETGYINAAEDAGLHVEGPTNLSAVVQGYEKTHARYYDTKVANSVMFSVRKV